MFERIEQSFQSKVIMSAKKIIAHRYFFLGINHMEPYRSYFSIAGMILTEKLTQNILQLPTGTEIDNDKIQALYRVIRFYIENTLLIVKNLGAESI